MKRKAFLLASIILFIACQRGRFVRHNFPAEYESPNAVDIAVLGRSLESEFDEGIFDIENFHSIFTDTQIIIQLLNSESILIKLQSDFACGQAPDLFAIWPGDLVKNFMRNRMLMDLTPYLEADPEWYGSFQYPELWAPVMSNGRIYGLPIEGITESLFVNMDILLKYKLGPPETIDDIVAICRSLRAAGILPLEITGWPDLSYTYQGLVCSHGTAESIAVPPTGVENNPYVDALYSLRRIYDADGFDLDLVTRLDTLRSGQAMISETAAMMFNGSWALCEVHQALGDKLKLMPFPAVNADDPRAIIFGLGSTTYYISVDPNRSRAETEELLHFAKHITGPAAVTKAFANGYIISNIPFIDKPSLVDMFPDLLTMAERLITPPDHGFSREVWYEKILYRIPAVLKNELSPEELWSQVGLSQSQVDSGQSQAEKARSGNKYER